MANRTHPPSFRLGPLLGSSIHLIPHDSPDLDRLDHLGPVGMVVIDEAHQVARWAVRAAGRDHRRFEALRSIVTGQRVRVLLLSATPTLHSDVAGFQALLHLLDPAVYPLGDLDGFRTRLEQHERVARLYHLFRPDEGGGYLEETLDNLTQSFPQDARLNELAADLRPLLGYGVAPDAPRREELILAVRAHVSEVYRLHRRLLRNRRVHDRIEGLLPGRIGIVRRDYADHGAAHRAGLIDEWRLAVSAGTPAEEYGRILVLLTEAACDPAALAAVVTIRLRTPSGYRLALTPRDREALAAPLLPDERPVLARIRDAATTADRTPRLTALVACLRELFGNSKPRVTRAVVFASHPSSADAVATALAAEWPREVLRHGQPGWEHFRTSRMFRVLVCDASAEEGLNLNGPQTVLVHYDLPWSPNRVEQRVGRLDRYGRGSPVRSVVLVAEGDPLSAAWVDYLDRGFRVFDRSVAALQYLIECELTDLFPAVLADGAAAVTQATNRLAGEGGLVESTLADIQVLDELDAVETPPGHEHFADTLRQADDMCCGEWRDATHDWVGEGLQFARRTDDGPDSPTWRYQFLRPNPYLGGRSTLMPTDRLTRHFRYAVDAEDERNTVETPITYPMSFSRQRAQIDRAALARVGDPFVDALTESVGWDDRGTCSALWRYRPGCGVEHPAEVAFRFEFVVECPIAEAIAALPAEGGWSPFAIRRLADWLFPPFPICVWLDGQLEIVSDPSKLAALVGSYSKKQGPGGEKDFNLNPHRWSVVEPHFPRSDWVLRVGEARRVAEETVRGSTQWATEIGKRLDAAGRTVADRATQAASRIAFLTGTFQAHEETRAAVELAVSAALLAGVAAPAVRLDSVGAVFLSNWNPFTDDDE
ncbi:MAG: protein DpdE [Gemmataceae bacterium]